MNDEELLRLPWSVAPLRGKYYGTVIVDSAGVEVMSITRSNHDIPVIPSERESQVRENICDSHWESQEALDAARRICELVNGQSQGERS